MDAVDVIVPCLFAKECGVIDGEPFGNCYSEADTSDRTTHQAAEAAVRHFQAPFNRFLKRMDSTNPKYRTRVRPSWLLLWVRVAISMTDLDTLLKGVGAERCASILRLRLRSLPT